jgi:4-hydroxythreonine-4-phosphate dehydrogenase
MKNLPVIGITMGDPSGIGPEIIIKTLSDETIYEVCRPVVYGDPGALDIDVKGISRPPIRDIRRPNESQGISGQIDLIVCSRLKRESIVPGKPSLEGGSAMVEYIIKATEEAISKELSAIVTSPINKALMNEAGHHFEGHTQLISRLTGSKDFLMMLAGDRLRVTLVTIHCALKDVPTNIDEVRIFKTITGTYKGLKEDFAIENPRIAVAALNPHGGEAGLFGVEEKEIIMPALKRARNEGYNVTGPLSPDTVYHKAASGDFDAVVSMYHDQGLIPLKLLHFSNAVNVTLGLPIIRTSVDHGTAYDIAGRGIADPSSLKAAIRMAAEIAENRKKVKVLQDK